MHTARKFFSVFLLLFLLIGSKVSVSFGAEYEGVKITPLIKTTTSTDGQKLSYPKIDNPEVTAVIVEIPPGGETGWHLHPVAVYAYVLSGSLTIEIESGKRYNFKEGDAIIEVVNTAHNGMNTGQVPVKLVVFYTGEQEKPTTIKVKRK